MSPEEADALRAQAAERAETQENEEPPSDVLWQRRSLRIEGARGATTRVLRHLFAVTLEESVAVLRTLSVEERSDPVVGVEWLRGAGLVQVQADCAMWWQANADDLQGDEVHYDDLEDVSAAHQEGIGSGLCAWSERRLYRLALAKLQKDGGK